MAMDAERLAEAIIANLALAGITLTEDQEESTLTSMTAIAQAIIDEIETHYEPPA